MEDNTKDIKETEAKETEAEELGEPALWRIVVPGTMSGAEMLEFWKDNGVFDVAWPQYDDIGPGKKYADSTEYVQAMRARADYRGH